MRLAGLAEQRAARVDLVGLEQRVADPVALGGEEREAHPAADDELVDDARAGRRSRRACRTPSRRRARRRTGAAGCSRSPSSTSTSRSSSRPAADGSVPRRTDDRGVGPVRRAEGVVDVDVEAVDELRRRRRGRWPPRRGRSAGSRAARPRARARRAGPAPARRSTSGRARPSGRPRWVHAVTRRALLLQPPMVGQRGADAEVVGDARRPAAGR